MAGSPRIVAGVLIGLSLATCGLAIATNPLPSDDSAGRFASPAVADRRDYKITRQSVSADGTAAIAGAIPGDGAIKDMRWYVNGSPVAPTAVRLSGTSFEVALKLPPDRTRWTVFAIAKMSGFAHYVPMRAPLFLAPADAGRFAPETSAYVKTPMGRAQASLDFVTGDGPSIALAGQTLLRWNSGARMLLVGWAIDKAAEQAPRAVFVGFDQELFRASVDTDRPDVAKAFSNRAYTRSGFTATIPSTSMRPGPHQITVFVLNSSGQIEPAVNLNVFVSTM